jgi:MHS family proline/betaine transporter-like MFS transporter
MTSSTTSPRVPARPSARRATVTAAIGTFVEYYDFVIYAYFASVFGPLFFPATDPRVSLLLSFVVFATSYAVRPLGGLIFGPLGDRFGRRNVLAVVILLMSGATTAIGVLPTYAQVGIVAPVLITLARLVQGISVGGEFGGAASYVAEFAPVRRRGLYMSWLGVAIGLGALGGAIVAASLTVVLPESALATWGWRVPFLLAFPLGIVGLYLRLRLEDTPEFDEIKKSGEVEKAPLRTSLRTELPSILLTIGVLAGMTVFTYLYLIFTPSYLTTFLGYDRTTALVANIACVVGFCVGMPMFGALTDRVGRKPVLMVGSVLLAAASYPGFAMMGQGSTVLLAGVLAVLGVLTSMCFASSLPILPELFATATRYTSLSMGWNIAATLFGGAAPLIATALITGTGNDFAPAFYAILGGLLSLITAFIVRETAGVRLTHTHHSPVSETPTAAVASAETSQATGA